MNQVEAYQRIINMLINYLDKIRQFKKTNQKAASKINEEAYKTVIEISKELTLFGSVEAIEAFTAWRNGAEENDAPLKIANFFLQLRRDLMGNDDKCNAQDIAKMFFAN